jgi:hypothetical protein
MLGTMLLESKQIALVDRDERRAIAFDVQSKRSRRHSDSNQSVADQ